MLITEEKILEGNLNEDSHIYVEHDGKFYRGTVRAVATILQTIYEKDKTFIGGETAENLLKVVKSIEKSESGLRVTYFDGQEENVEVATSGGQSFDGGYQDPDGYIHLTKEGEDIEGFDPFLVAGGGDSGGTGGSKITFACYTSPSFSVMESSGTALITFKYASIDTETKVSTGAGNLSISVGGTVKANMTIQQGDNLSVDVFPYLTNGANTVKLVITDSYGTIASRNFTVTVESFGIEWSLGNTYKNTEDVLSFYITPTGSGSKTIYVYLDDKLYSTDIVTTSGRRLTKTISGLKHGMHTIEVYGLMEVGGATLESDHLTAAVAQIDRSSTTPVVAVKWPDSTLTQYTSEQISYIVIDPENNPSEVQLFVNGVSQSVIEIDQSEHIWSYRPVITGNVTLGILCGNTMVEKDIIINAIGADVDEVLDGLNVKVDPSIISDLQNWSYGPYNFKLSDNFDLINGGLQTDSDGVHCIRITAGDRLTLSYPLFNGDARRTGKEAKIIYKVANSSNKEAEAISCMDNGIGLRVLANNAYLSGDQTTIKMSTCEDMKTELDINIKQDSEDRLMCLSERCSTYVYNQYSASESFTHAGNNGVIFGSDDADVYLYLFRAYNRDLTDDELKANFICDGADGAEINSRQDRNDIYDSAGNIDIEKAASKNPNAHFIIINAERMTKGKSDTVNGSIQHIYVAGGIEHRFTADVDMKVQGTSSVEHAETAGPNIKFKLKDGIILEDGTHKEGYAIHGEKNSIPVTVLNYKKNIASEDHIVNMMCANVYQTFQPTIRQARLDDPRVRDCLEACMCVVLFHNTGSVATQVGPDIVQPDETIFFGLGNLCTDKDAVEAFQYDPIVIEVKNNTEDSVRFKSDDLSDFDTNFEFRYLNETVYTEQQAKALFQDMVSFVHVCDYTEATNTALPKAVNIDGQAFTTDSPAYRKAKWKAEAKNYFDMPSLYWHHNVTLFHLLRDNRAKNMFWSYNPDEGVWSLRFNWDNDTGHCRNNEGYIDIEPGYMDFDVIGTADVFNASDNVIFSNLRECNMDELKASYIDRESAGAWNIDNLYSYAMTNQEYICEALWLEDAQHNAIRTMQNLGTTAYLERATGRLRLHLKKSLLFQKALVDSYYCATACISDSASFRGYTPSTWKGVKPSGIVTVTMYTDIYINVLAGSTAYRVRAQAGIPITIDISAALNDTEIYWRNAEWYTAFGDLSPLYLGQFEASKLKRVRELMIGSYVDGYSNTNFTTASFDNCVKLEKLNMGGLVNASKAFDFSPNIYLKYLYTKGSGITGITFAKNGRLQEAYLNAVTALYMNGLNQLKKFEMESKNLTSITIENSPAVDSYAIVAAAVNLQRVRLLKIAWSVPVGAYDTLIRLKNIHGIDDDGYDVADGIVTGAVNFQSISKSKYNDIVARIPSVEFTYGELLEEYTVTFKNYDGTVLFVTKVERGGTVKDPVTDGTIGKPVKPADENNVYDFYKWDTPLDYIISDTEITATYKESVRVNIVKYVDKDGTVLEEYEVSAHESCRYQGKDLYMSGYVWIGWDKEAKNVIEDMTITAVYIYPALPAEKKDMNEYEYAYSDDSEDDSAYTFGEFYAICKTGQVAKYLPVTTKIKMIPDTDVITDTSIVFDLHSIGHYELSDGKMSNADFYMIGLLTQKVKMNTVNTNVGGWNSCEMRKWLNNTLYQALPPKWRNIISLSKTLANEGNQSTKILSSDDYLRIPSSAEMGFDISAVPYKDEISENAAEIAFSQYTNATSKIKKQFNGEGAAQDYWLRSADAGSVVAFRDVNHNGYSDISTATDARGACIGFSL